MSFDWRDREEFAERRRAERRWIASHDRNLDGPIEGCDGGPWEDEPDTKNEADTDEESTGEDALEAP